NLAQLMPDSVSLELGMLGAVEGLVTADFDGDSLDDVVALQGCTPFVRSQPDLLAELAVLGPMGACALGVGRYDDDSIPDLVVLRSDASFTVVNVFNEASEPRLAFGLNGVYSAVAPVRLGAISPPALFVQEGPELE